MTDRDALEVLRFAGASVEGPSSAARARGRAALEGALRTAPGWRGSLALRISALAVAAVLAIGVVFGLGLSRSRSELGDVRADPRIHAMVTRIAFLDDRITVVREILGRSEPPARIDERARLRELKSALEEACARIQSLPPAC